MSSSTNAGTRDHKNLQICPITPADLEEVARFICRLSASTNPLAAAVKRLNWILIENPVRCADDPLGWLLRHPSGELAGCMCCAPQRFCVGATTITLMMANSFYVEDRYRGTGTSIFLKFLQLGRNYPLFVSSANPTVANMWKKLGGYPLGNSDQEVLAMLNYAPLAAESVHRRTRSDLVARVVSAAVSPLMRARNRFLADAPRGELQPLASPEEASALCARHSSDKITGCRDLPFLKWRYFSGVDPATRVFVFRSGAEKEFMIGARLQSRGYKQQIRALHVLDIWGEPDPNSSLAIAGALCREYRGQIDMLVFRCLDSIHTAALTSQGFRIREFSAPIAWCIDKCGLLPTKPWYFVPADGDMFL